MGPSQPDFLCVFSADNGDVSSDKQEPKGGGGHRVRGPGQTAPGVGKLSHGPSESSPETARNQGWTLLETLGRAWDGGHKPRALPGL